MKKRIVLIILNIFLALVLCVGNIIMWNLPYRHFSYKQYTPYIIVNHKDKFGNPDPHYDCECDKGAVEYLYGENLIYMKNFGASREFVSSQNSGTITENHITDGEMLKNALDNFLSQYYDISSYKYEAYATIYPDEGWLIKTHDIEEGIKHEKVKLNAFYSEHINGIATGEGIDVSVNKKGQILSVKHYQSQILEKYGSLQINRAEYISKLDNVVKYMCSNSEYSYFGYDIDKEYLTEYNGNPCVYIKLTGNFDLPDNYYVMPIEVYIPLTNVIAVTDNPVLTIISIASAVLLSISITVSIIISRKKSAQIPSEQEEETE